MDIDYLQAERYKLQKRFRRMHSAEPAIYPFTIKYFWNFIRDHHLFGGVVEDLKAQESGVIEGTVEHVIENDQGLYPDTERELAALGLTLLEHCAEAEDQGEWRSISYQYTRTGDANDRVRFLTESIFEPLYEYLDEQIDDRGAVLSLVRRYKHRCEWFDRKKLYELWAENTERGERLLANHLYKYLHDQGLRFFVEPRSASGRADLIDAQSGDNRLLADAKIFHPGKSKGRSYLADGIGQLYRYCVDYQQAVGYLVIYKTSEHDLRFILEEQQSQVPQLNYNHKTLFLLEIDIFPYDESASERGELEPYEVTQEDLLSSIEDSG